MLQFWRRTVAFFRRCVREALEVFTKNTRKRLLWAIKNEDLKLLEELAAKGADLKVPISGRDTALLVAVRGNSLPVVA